MTEKNYNPEQKTNKSMNKQPKAKIVQPKIKSEEKKMIETQPKQEEQEVQANALHSEEKELIEDPIEEEQGSSGEFKKNSEAQKVDEKKTEEKTTETPKSEKNKKDKSEIKKPVKKIKKEEVYVNAKSVPVSTKYAMSICKFIKGKRIGDAIQDLEQVILLKKSVPMKGEYSHRKGKGKSGGAFPQRASKQFVVLLKSLAGNANNHEISEPIIVEASANWASAPKGKFGRIRRKRTHVTLKAIEMKIKETKKMEEKK